MKKAACGRKGFFLLIGGQRTRVGSHSNSWRQLDPLYHSQEVRELNAGSQALILFGLRPEPVDWCYPQLGPAFLPPPTQARNSPTGRPKNSQPTVNHHSQEVPIQPGQLNEIEGGGRGCVQFVLRPGLS